MNAMIAICETKEFRHSTSREVLANILQDGLLPESWITEDHVEHMSRDQRVHSLELNDKSKGECVCKLKISTCDTFVPRAGPTTSHGATQSRTLPITKVAKENCECETQIPWGTIALVGAGLCGLIGLVVCISKQRQNQRHAPVNSY